MLAPVISLFLMNIQFSYFHIINPEKLIKNPEISSDGASANLSLYLTLLSWGVLCTCNFTNLLCTVLGSEGG